MAIILLPSSDQMAELEELKPIRHHITSHVCAQNVQQG